MAEPIDITAIIERIRAGEKTAFAELLHRFQRPLFGFLGRMGLAQGPAEEVAQETFLRAWRNLGDYDRQRGEFSTWLYALARNLAINELARASHRHETAMGDEVPDAACDRPQPLASLLMDERRRQLHDALRRLPLEDRSALALAYNDDLALADVARIEGCSTGAIKTRLHRAKRKLRELLEVHHG
jgi:RNA polymerase sigma-70 factor (ECF subfamily)